MVVVLAEAAGGQRELLQTTTFSPQNRKIAERPVMGRSSQCPACSVEAPQQCSSASAHLVAVCSGGGGLVGGAGGGSLGLLQPLGAGGLVALRPLGIVPPSSLRNKAMQEGFRNALAS